VSGADLTVEYATGADGPTLWLVATPRGMSLGWYPSTRYVQLGHICINLHKRQRQSLNVIYARQRGGRTAIDQTNLRTDQPSRRRQSWLKGIG
jgi:hypothetical protein